MSKELKLSLLIGVVYLITAYFSVGYFSFDEHFQILEFAHWKLGFGEANNLPWEFAEQIRPSFQPAVLVGFYKLISFFNLSTDPFYLLTIFRLLSAGLGLFAIYGLYFATVKKIKPNYKLAYLFSLSLIWFFPFILVRFSSESWASSFFVLGFSWLFYLLRQEVRQEDKKVSELNSELGFKLGSKLSYLGVGWLFGLAFLCRYQVGVMVFGLIVWWLVDSWKRNLANSFIKIIWVLLGVFMVVVAGVLIDYWFYGDWVLTSYRYFFVNIVEERASTFGTDSIWYYFTSVFLYWIPPFSVGFVSLFFAYFIFYPKSLITGVVILFLGVHFMIPHKETRFLLPIMWFVPFMVFQMFARWEDSGYFLRPTKWLKSLWVWVPFLSMNGLLLLVVMLRPADDLILLNEKVFREVSRLSGNNLNNKITLYYDKNTVNLYRRVGLELDFYKPRSVELVEVEDLSKESAYKPNSLWLSDHPINTLSDGRLEMELIFQSPHSWLRKINFYNWIEKSKLKQVYLYRRKEVD